MRFEAAFGPGGERPESYWQPILGYRYGLRPADLGDMTPEQLLAAYDWALQD